MILVDGSGLVVSRPGKPLFEDLSLTVANGDRLGVVGVNGSGKSTLLGVLAGTVEPEEGTVRRGRDTRVTFLDQASPLPPGTVREVAGGGHESDAVLDRLGMTPLLEVPTTELSGGEAKRVALARALVAVERTRDSSESDLLILDEPTNHLDIAAIAWLEQWLERFRGGLMLVTHDRHVLDRLTTRMVEIEAGRTFVHDGGYQSYLDAKAERREREESAEQVRRNLARSELAWLRRGAKARSRKPKADVAAALKIVNGRPVAPERPDELPLHELTQTPRLGNTVIELHGVAAAPGDADEAVTGGEVRDGLLFRGLDLVLDRRARLGIVGPNGSGKSTLLDVIAGRRRPDEGKVVQGQTVRLGYFDQHGVELPLDGRVREVVAGPTRQPDWSDAALLERFWFATDTQWAPVRLLSGGERRRLQLVLALRQAPNVLLLDEPTNDLDLDTLRALEDLLDDWAGALVAVSHDRAFLERVTDEVLVLDGHGVAERRSGGAAAALERLVASSGAAGAAGPVGPGGSGGSARSSGSGRPGGSGSGGSGPAGEASKGRSASTLRQRLKDNQTQLSRLQRRQEALEAEVEAAVADPAELAILGARLAEVQSEVAEMEDRWLELAEEAEAVGLKV